MQGSSRRLGLMVDGSWNPSDAHPGSRAWANTVEAPRPLNPTVPTMFQPGSERYGPICLEVTRGDSGHRHPWWKALPDKLGTVTNL